MKKMMASVPTECPLGGDWETGFVVLNAKRARYRSLHLAVCHLVLQLFVHRLLSPRSANTMQQDHMKSLVRQRFPLPLLLVEYPPPEVQRRLLQEPQGEHLGPALFNLMMTVSGTQIVLKLVTKLNRGCWKSQMMPKMLRTDERPTSDGMRTNEIVYS